MRNPENKLAMQETTMERPRGLIPARLQSPDAENRTSGGVGALAGATSRQGDPIFQELNTTMQGRRLQDYPLSLPPTNEFFE